MFFGIEFATTEVDSIDAAGFLAIIVVTRSQIAATLERRVVLGDL